MSLKPLGALPNLAFLKWHDHELSARLVYAHKPPLLGRRHVASIACAVYIVFFLFLIVMHLIAGRCALGFKKTMFFCLFLLFDPSDNHPSRTESRSMVTPKRAARRVAAQRETEHPWRVVVNCGGQAAVQREVALRDERTEHGYPVCGGSVFVGRQRVHLA